MKRWIVRYTSHVAADGLGATRVIDADTWWTLNENVIAFETASRNTVLLVNVRAIAYIFEVERKEGEDIDASEAH